MEAIGAVLGGDYQASTFGPISAPMTVGTSMPSTYQKPIKLAAISGQCRQYTRAAALPDAKPAAAPARRKRVGAIWRISFNTAAMMGADSMAIRKGQARQVVPQNNSCLCSTGASIMMM